MKLTFRFAEKDDQWNIYATLLSALYLVLFYAAGVPLTPSVLVLITLLVMQHGKLEAKIMFTLFLHLLLSLKMSTAQLYYFGVSCVALAIGHVVVPQKRPIMKELVSFIQQYRVSRYFIWGAIYIWMAYIGFIFFV